VFFNGSVRGEGPATAAASLVLHWAHDTRGSPVDGDWVCVVGWKGVLRCIVVIYFFGFTGVTQEVLDLVSS
jgi:hypothetical protein